MSMCSRPVIETQLIAGHTFARCLICSRLSPPGQDADGSWALEHHMDAIAVNVAIGDTTRSDLCADAPVGAGVGASERGGR